MKQKKLQTDILFLIIFVFWTIVAGTFYLLIHKYESSNPEKVVMIFKILVGITYFPVAFFPIILYCIHRHCKLKGEGKPLSLNAMREGKKHIPDTIYKFCSLTSRDTKNNLNNAKLQTLKNKEIWFSKCADLNDPFEGQMFILSEKDLSKNGLPEEIKQKYGVENTEGLLKLLSNQRNKYCQSSFSAAKNDVQMWGYYANSCRGYCVEYKVLNNEMLFPVFYLNKRLILSEIPTQKKHHRLFRKNLTQVYKSLYEISSHEFIQYNIYLQSFKFSKWAFEKEIRAIDITAPDDNGGNRPSENYGLQPTKIIVGYLSAYIDELQQIAIQLGISFSIMKPDYGSSKFALIEQAVL